MYLYNYILFRKDALYTVNFYTIYVLSINILLVIIIFKLINVTKLFFLFCSADNNRNITK